MVSKNRLRYRLDNSGIIHLAVLKKGISNSFRLSLTLHDVVDHNALQKALNNITPRFPMLAAGIKEGFFHHYVVPVETAPEIMPADKTLAYMPMKQIRKCAMRVLYDEHHIIVEFFHSLTDGSGGSIFLKSLLAEYLHITYGLDYSDETDIISPDSIVHEFETEDSFIRYSHKKAKSFNTVQSYQLKSNAQNLENLHTTTISLDLEDILSAAHYYKITVTEFLTTIMADSVMELQTTQEHTQAKWKPVQIMVPVNLRKHFPSRTLRNFTLYALTCINPKEKDLSFTELSELISAQLQEQLQKEHLSSMITTNVRLQEMLKWLPLKLKCIGLRFSFHLIGSKNSCLSISNIGAFSLPESMLPYISRVDFLLTPRICSSYNCGVVSYQNQLHINFTRRGDNSLLEKIFLQKLCGMGFIPELKTDDSPIDFQKFINLS